MLLKVVHSLEGMVADLTGVLSMGSFMPLPVVSSVEHLVTDTAAVGL
jgi:hypothetical protein